MDQYYWLTAMLAARGLQSVTRRVVAVSLVVCALLPPAMMFSSVGARGEARLLVLATTAVTLAVPALWLRGRWPTRAQSILTVLVATGNIAVGCLTTGNPLAGLLGATAFAPVATYLVLFHSLRYAVLPWLVAAATVGVLVGRVSGADVALAICVVVLLVAVNALMVFLVLTMVRLTAADVDHERIEPLTGLLNRDAAYEQVATMLAARSRGDDRYLVFAAVSIDNFAALVDLAGSARGDAARVAIAQTLRENVRRDAILAHVADAEFLVVDTFTDTDPSPLVRRLLSAIAAAPAGLTASIGVVTTPLPPLAEHPPHEVIEEVNSIAGLAMYEARLAGGNQARYVLRPSLRSVEDGGADR
ncbi:diguanylate cyclase [uncultured Mycolicibacterium sp.]|uniref:GGDEF domain-containing protein n=1 Tax=uncultured Mycolicibacterium sp. TaxID=2320817 RepID=UPI002603E856|nr:GGDEF domain-containing protein [uncultured Mycolicibacterium sp.]